jgi:hypothetical protein
LSIGTLLIFTLLHKNRIFFTSYLYYLTTKHCGMTNICLDLYSLITVKISHICYSFLGNPTINNLSQYRDSSWNRAWTIRNTTDGCSADGTRIALADSGDGIEPNFSSEVAQKSVLRIYNEIQWTEEILAKLNTFEDRPVATFYEKLFQSQINYAILKTADNYENNKYKDALQSSFYYLHNARDTYRSNAEVMNKNLLLRFIEVHALVMVPIIPHFAECIWKLLKKVTIIGYSFNSM